MADIKKIAVFMIVLLLLLAGISNATAIANGNGNPAYVENIKKISPPQSRYVWVEGMEPVFNFTPLNSDLFYYDIDTDAGEEEIIIDIGDPSRRTIEVDNLTYQTSIFNTSFKYRRFGNYSAIGFMGEKYLAAYTNDSNIASKPVNLVSRRILSKILVDENIKHSLISSNIKKRQYWENILLSDGYELLAENVSMSSQTAIISIIWNGIKIYHKKVKPGDIVVYEKAVDKFNSIYGYQKENLKNFPLSLPILAIHVDSIMVEDGKPAVIIDGIFQLEDGYTDIDPEYGLLGITQVNETGITMKNRMKATLTFPENMDFVNILSEYISPIYLIGNIKLKFADSKDLRFLVNNQDMPVNHERRGSVYQESSPVLAWDGLNFPGFWYDIYSDRFSEKLEVKNISGRIIPEGYLRYNIAGVNTQLEVAGFNGSELHGLNNTLKFFGIGTEKYLSLNGNSTELSKIILEKCGSQYNKRTIAVGEVWELGQGYNLTVKELEVRSDPRKALLSVSHNGTVLKDSWVTRHEFFSYYENDSLGKQKILKFFTYLDEVFVGCCFDIAQIRYAFLTSENITRIHIGDRIGAMRVIDVEPDLITMENDQDIYLKPGSDLNLIGNLSFRVANSKDLRFYPVNTRGEEIGFFYMEEELNETLKREIKEEIKNETGIIDDRSINTPTIITGSSNSVPVVEWSRTYGGVDDDRATGVWQTLDGGFIVTGNTTSVDRGINEAWIMKLDIKGNEQWTRTLTGKGNAMISAFSQTLDGGYIISGFTELNESDHYDAWFMKMDINGYELWNRTLTGPAVTGANSIQQTDDGGFIATGWTDRYSEGRLEGWLLKTDFESVEEWKRTYIVKEESIVASFVSQTLDSGFIILGRTESYTGDNHAWIIKTDARGMKEWEKTFGGHYDDMATSGQQTKNGYIISGVTWNNILNRFSLSNAWIVKTDPKGNEQWNKALRESLFSNVVNSIQHTDDGGYVLSGSTGTYGLRGYDAWIIKLGSQQEKKETPGFQVFMILIILLLFYKRIKSLIRPKPLNK